MGKNKGMWKERKNPHHDRYAYPWVDPSPEAVPPSYWWLQVRATDQNMRTMWRDWVKVGEPYLFEDEADAARLVIAAESTGDWEFRVVFCM